MFYAQNPPRSHSQQRAESCLCRALQPLCCPSQHTRSSLTSTLILRLSHATPAARPFLSPWWVCRACSACQRPSLSFAWSALFPASRTAPPPSPPSALCRSPPSPPLRSAPDPLPCWPAFVVFVPLPKFWPSSCVCARFLSSGLCSLKLECFI